mmetsp:Transcript_15417/g.23441  ORF Transcript_15417/g.23441 Transcript_15417/m.23441 type:complete len:97 (+) Transcript_15417:206-496(+)
MPKLRRQSSLGQRSCCQTTMETDVHFMNCFVCGFTIITFFEISHYTALRALFLCCVLFNANFLKKNAINGSMIPENHVVACHFSVRSNQSSDLLLE